MIINMNTRKNNYLYALEFLTSMIVILFMSIIAAIQNNGLEGDEVFSYISATSAGGFKGICYLKDQTWYDAEYFRNAVSSTGSERFNIKMVIENQVMDTHPPLYYLILNLICSIFKGQYSRWFGIGLNIFFILCMNIGLYLLIRYFIQSKHISLITSTIFCCSYLALGMTLFIRMYVLCMTLTIFQSWHHLRAYDKIMSVSEYPIKKHWKTYGILMLLTIVGGLTHYYFLVYQCLIAAAFTAALWQQKKYKDIYRYILIMITSAIIYVILYPASIYHIFFKYRGRDAVHKFLKESSLFGDALSTLSALNKDLFKGNFLIIILLLSIVTIILLVMKKIEYKQLKRLGFLILPSLIYFYGVSKASPYIMTRYISPVAALIYAFIVIWAKYLTDTITYSKIRNTAYIAICTFLFCTCFYFFKPSIKASYFAERRNVINELSQNATYCVYICDGENYWKMWEDYINYPTFQGLYFIDGQQKAAITDKKLLEQNTLVIYLDNTLNVEDILTYLQTYLPLQQYDVKYITNYTYIILGHL